MASHVNVESTCGPLFIGLLVSAILLGITTVQGSTFIAKGSHEPPLHRLVVVALWILDILSTTFQGHTLYHLLITNHHRLHWMPRLLWACKAIFAMDSIIIFVAQSLYIMRIRRLLTLCRRPRRVALTTILSLISLSSLVFGLYTTYKLSTLPPRFGFDSLLWEVYLCLGSTCLTDSIISILLITLLAKCPKGTSWTDSTLVVLASYALNTGIFTGLFSVAALAAYAIDNDSYAFLGIRIMLSTFHINSLVGMLNARHYFQKGQPAMVVLQSHDAFLTFSNGGSVHASRRRPTTAEKEAQPTINEAGFPQFPNKPAIKPQCDVVEVVVAKEQSTTISRLM